MRRRKATTHGPRLMLCAAGLLLLGCDDFEPPSPTVPATGTPTPPLVVDAGVTPDASAPADEDAG